MTTFPTTPGSLVRATAAARTTPSIFMRIATAPDETPVWVHEGGGRYSQTELTLTEIIHVDGNAPTYTIAEWEEWSNDLAVLVPEDAPWVNHEGAQEGIISEHFGRLARIEETRRGLAEVVAAEALEWTAVHVEPGDRYPDEGEKLTPGWYVIAQDPDLDPENGAPVILQVAALNLNADHADCGEDRGQQVAEALARMLGGARAVLGETEG